MSDQAKTVVVTGDFTLDWNLARNQGAASSHWILDAGAATRLGWQRGGSGLLTDLVAELARRQGGDTAWRVLQQQTPRPENTEQGNSGQINPEDQRFHHSCALWKPFDYSCDPKTNKDQKKAWRVAEFLGGRVASPVAPKDWACVVNDDPAAQLVVLDDAALGFRDHPELWPASLTAPGATPWVLLKISRPVAKGKLWEHLLTHHAGKLIVLMTVDDLRQTEVQISRELSWERTAQDLLWEVAFNTGMSSLAQCAHVVVSFNAAGAMHYTRDAENVPHCNLIFDPEVVEGMWEQTIPGAMQGGTSCLAAGIVRELMLAPEEPKIADGVRTGLQALRTVYREGYGQRGTAVNEVVLSFPIAAAVNALEVPAKEYQQARVPMRTGGKFWTILSEQYNDNLEEIAIEVALRGPEVALAGVPFGRFGKLLTVDRQEIESLRSIRSLTSEYLSNTQIKRPLSIAVFGLPGSGKSFGITQLALALKPGEIEKKEFNLSQLRSTAELLSAFHQVRDIALRGKVPLIFWDEFDSNFDGQGYGWLRFFLAPMQDGEFLDGDLVHPIGRAIFVFAGGTSASLDGFGKGLTDKEKSSAKMPDFISRLKGYMNVLGPNRQSNKDSSFVLRRAILLNAFLSANKQLVNNKKVQIDEGVLYALLHTRQYKHGARSIESLMAMSQLDGKQKFERSSLPTCAQMDLHVYGHNFMALVHKLALTPERLDKMAAAVHESYCKQQKAAGWSHGETKSETAKTNPMLVEFGALNEQDKEQNREQVRDIENKLTYAGCYLVPALENDPPFAFDAESLEELADLEHTRWMRSKARDGWRWGTPRDDNDKLHPSMLPWSKGKLEQYTGYEEVLGSEELSQPEKDKDRDAVRQIPELVAQAGYSIVAQRNE